MDRIDALTDKVSGSYAYKDKEISSDFDHFGRAEQNPVRPGIYCCFSVDQISFCFQAIHRSAIQPKPTFVQQRLDTASSGVMFFIKIGPYENFRLTLST